MRGGEEGGLYSPNGHITPAPSDPPQTTLPLTRTETQPSKKKKRSARPKPKGDNPQIKKSARAPKTISKQRKRGKKEREMRVWGGATLLKGDDSGGLLFRPLREGIGGTVRPLEGG